MTVHSSLAAPAHQFSTEGGKQLLTLELPALDSLQGVDLDIGSSEIRLLLPGSCEHMLIPLPSKVGHAGLPTAKFSRKRRQLTVTWEDSEVPETAPAAEAVTNTVADEAATKTVTEALPANLNAVSNKKNDACSKELECLEVVQEEIEHALKQCTIAKLKSISAIRGCSVMLSDFSVEGNATMKKSSCNFRVKVQFKWDVMDAFGGYLGAMGHGEVSELTQEQESPKVLIRASSCASSQAKSAGEWMKRHGADLISECLSAEHLRDAILSNWEELAEEDASASQGMPEKKPINEWSHEWLTQKLSNLNVKLFGGSACATFAAPEISGDFTVSEQQGTPVPVFKVQLQSTWKLTAGASQTEGTCTVSNFTYEMGSQDAEVRFEATSGKKVSGQLLTALRQTGASAVRTILSQFLNEVQTHARS